MQSVNNRQKPVIVPTSDFMSSDFALVESVFFVRLCSSSSLLLESVLPLDSERTADGAAVTKESKKLFFSPTKAVRNLC